MQSFPGYKKISKTKLDRAGLWGYSKLRQESILFSFLFYCWIFQRREDKKYPQIFEERWRKCIFVSVERESEAIKVKFSFVFCSSSLIFYYYYFFFLLLLWLLMCSWEDSLSGLVMTTYVKKRTTSQARGWKSTPIKCINMKSS